MARKEIILTIDDGGTPLTVKIRQMPATRLESWIMRVVLLLAGSGVEVPEGADLQQAGRMLAAQGLKALGSVDYDKAKPLLDDLLHCCHRVLESGVETPITEATADGFIADVRTLFKLRLEALKLNLDFFGIGDLSPSPRTSGTAEATPTL